MKEVIEQLMEMMRAFIGDGQLAKLYAKFMRDCYLALIDEGFTPKEALEIACKMQMPTANAK